MSSSLPILIVSDSPTERRIVVNLLMQVGYIHADQQSSWNAGWDAISHGSYGLVVLKLQMGDVSGTKLVALLRGDARWRSLPIVMLTSGHLSDGDRQALAADPAIATVSLPCNAASLKQGIDTVLAAAPSS